MSKYSTEAIAKLGQAVYERRMELGISQDDIASSGGPSDVTVRNLELGVGRPPLASTLRGLDRALGWRQGSSLAVLNGGQPELNPVLVERSEVDLAIGSGEDQAVVMESSTAFEIALANASDAELLAELNYRIEALRRELAKQRPQPERRPGLEVGSVGASIVERSGYTLAARTGQRHAVFDEVESQDDGTMEPA